jgi:hypothetical protein
LRRKSSYACGRNELTAVEDAYLFRATHCNALQGWRLSRGKPMVSTVHETRRP